MATAKRIGKGVRKASKTVIQGQIIPKALERHAIAAEYARIEKELSITNDPNGTIRKQLRKYYQMVDEGLAGLERIEKVYTRNNKRIAGRGKLVGVKITGVYEKDGVLKTISDYGWIDQTGKLVREDDMKYALRGVDAALGGVSGEMGKFESAWENMSPKERAALVEKLSAEGFDWDVFWNELYDPETGELYEDADAWLAEMIGDVYPDFEYDAPEAADTIRWEDLARRSP